MKKMFSKKFKLNSPYHIDNTPVYHVPEEEGTLGRALDTEVVTVNENVTDIDQEKDPVKAILLVAHTGGFHNTFPFLFL